MKFFALQRDLDRQKEVKDLDAKFPCLGYGIYVKICQHLLYCPDYKDEFDVSKICRIVGMRSRRIVGSVLEDFGLFQFNAEHTMFWSPMILADVEKYEKKLANLKPFQKNIPAESAPMAETPDTPETPESETEQSVNLFGENITFSTGRKKEIMITDDILDKYAAYFRFEKLEKDAYGEAEKYLKTNNKRGWVDANKQPIKSEHDWLSHWTIKESNKFTPEYKSILKTLYRFNECAKAEYASVPIRFLINDFYKFCFNDKHLALYLHRDLFNYFKLDDARKEYWYSIFKKSYPTLKFYVCRKNDLDNYEVFDLEHIKPPPRE
ncbi:MAG: DUF4373 domain-containing protein [Prevotellaceae bacterium]|nr:DUF4373 domain-containing protein [Prevotellaceae bacterium]